MVFLCSSKLSKSLVMTEQLKSAQEIHISENKILCSILIKSFWLSTSNDTYILIACWFFLLQMVR